MNQTRFIRPFTSRSPMRAWVAICLTWGFVGTAHFVAAQSNGGPRGDQARTDLAITKDDGVTSVVPGELLTYTIVVANNGPSPVVGATVTDPFPVALTNVTYTSVAVGGASGNTANGNGDINDSVDMPVGSTITYTVTATVATDATGMIVNTAIVTEPPANLELDPSNNLATDTDDVTPVADLSITKDDGVTSVMQGDALTYTIVVSNAGPSDAFGAAVADTFPASLANVSFTSAATGGATGNAVNGTGDISDTVDMPVGSTITYTVMANVATDAAGTIDNTASVTAAAGTTDPNLANNTASDSDDIIVPEPEPEPEPEPQPTPCPQYASGLNLLFSLLFHSPVCGLGCPLTLVGTFCGIVALRTRRRHIRSRRRSLDSRRF